MSDDAATMIPTVPFRISFVPMVDDSSRPALHSYSWMVGPNGTWYILGGRRAGLHRFTTTSDNFPDPNTTLWGVNVSAPKVVPLLDLTLLDPAIGDPLTATNQQSFYDRTTDEWLIVGGYGLDSTTKAPRTFPTLLRIPATRFIAAVTSPATPAAKAAAVNAMVHRQEDPFFAVTGGVLRRIGSRYVLAFGQGFNGGYSPFTGLTAQDYTSSVRHFSLDPRTGLATNMGALTSPDLDQPFHRRDGVYVDTIDPATGDSRLAAFGGVFPSGQLDGYRYPVYIHERFGQLVATVDRSVNQLFNQYQCPTIVVRDPATGTVHHTFFGGISRSWYHHTDAQQKVFDDVTSQGRNDGLPFVSDVTTLVLRPDGTSSQYIWPDPVPAGALRGASTDFVPIAPRTHLAVTDGGFIDLGGFAPDETATVGYIYGGIDADFPFPVIPSYGTQATNALYQVQITRSVSPALYPASQGHLAVGYLPPDPPPA